VNLKKIFTMVMEPIQALLVSDIRVTLKIISTMAKVFSIFQVEIALKVTL
jgi:hypothetical protein